MVKDIVPDNSLVGKHAKQKQQVVFSDDAETRALQVAVDVVASMKKTTASMKSVLDNAEALLKKFAYEHWAAIAVAAGKMPDMRRFVGRKGHLDVVQDAKITVTTKKLQKLAELNFNVPSEYIEDDAVTIDMGAAEALGISGLILEILQDNLSGEDYAAVVKQKQVLGKKFFKALPKLGGTAGRVADVLKALAPTVRFRAPDSELSAEDSVRLAESQSRGAPQLPEGVLVKQEES